LSSIRKLVGDTPLYSALKTLGHYPDYWYWLLRGKPARSPHLVKQRTVLEYSRKYHLRTVIESGTYYGEMVAAMRPHFDRIISIEQNAALAARAQMKFARYPHITILEGDSQKVLPNAISRISEPALFWLDAGYYGWAGAQGDQRRLGVELDAILRHPAKGHVILMDDASGLNGLNGAPTIYDVRAQIESEFPGRKTEVALDILRITPAR
jgi:hypothetical protein